MPATLKTKVLIPCTCPYTCSKTTAIGAGQLAGDHRVLKKVRFDFPASTLQTQENSLADCGVFDMKLI